MVTHIVIFTWIEGTTDDQVSLLGAEFAKMAQAVGVEVVRHGPDLGFRDGGGDYAVIVTFANRGAWDAYQADPRHQAFVHEVVAPLQASRLTIQI